MSIVSINKNTSHVSLGSGDAFATTVMASTIYMEAMDKDQKLQASSSKNNMKQRNEAVKFIMEVKSFVKTLENTMNEIISCIKGRDASKTKVKTSTPDSLDDSANANGDSYVNPWVLPDIKVTANDDQLILHFSVDSREEGWADRPANTDIQCPISREILVSFGINASDSPDVVVQKFLNFANSSLGFETGPWKGPNPKHDGVKGDGSSAIYTGKNKDSSKDNKMFSFVFQPMIDLLSAHINELIPDRDSLIEPGMLVANSTATISNLANNLDTIVNTLNSNNQQDATELQGCQTNLDRASSAQRDMLNSTHSS